MKKRLIIFIIFLSFPLPIKILHAAPTNNDAALQGQIRNLEHLLKSIENLSEKIVSNQEKLQSSEGIGREDELRSQINDLSLKLKEMEKTFIQLSTGMEIRTPDAEKKHELDWNKEFNEFLGPIMRELKKVTSRPREIEKLRSKIENYESLLPLTMKANKNIEVLLTKTTNPRLIEKLKKIRNQWENRELEIRTQMSIAVQQLNLKLGERKPLSQSFQEILQIFFKSRGRNLIIAFLTFVIVWFILYWVHRVIQRYSPFHGKDRTFYVRIFDMLYIVFTIVVSFLAFLAVLYFFGDWVVLSIAIIFILGITWASKQAIPRFWDQGRLILNFGPVRERERVIYNGLPYEVATINLFTELVNRELEGGRIRLPLKDLLALRSRPMTDNEPWFPSRRGDWVLLSDGTHGKVVVQTPEMVKLVLLGDSYMTLKTVDYLSRSPLNLSTGFRLWITFGLDYGHLDIITHEIPPIIEKDIVDGLKAEGHGEDINNILAEFKNAGPSSLDVEIITDFKGNAGAKYHILNRAIQRICVDTCNRNHWVIPFQQVTVHMAQPSGG